MSNNRSSLELGPSLIINIVLLFIPGLRLFGGIWMFSRIVKTRRERPRRNTGVGGRIIAIAFCLLACGEILGHGMLASFGFFSALAIGLVAYFFLTNRYEDKLRDLDSYMKGMPSISFDAIEKTLGIREKELRFLFRSLYKRELVPPAAYIDWGRRCIVLTPEGRTEEEPEPKKEAAAQGDFEEDAYTKILHDIRHMNDIIDDEVVSEKIDHIENTTANIFHLVKKNPERVKDIQTFLEYYLPTMLKLLAGYAELEKQPVAGKNITEAKGRIENLMDKLVEGFDAQLDRLFKSEAIDITSDVNVMEKMMRMEGLNK